ncbi:transmembrane protein 256 homolog [Panulirus ornatus]|uniref:transmembrane protein 256 homolog n=1 Tax=Panulirus ornatus TaxID=150431 RepID=UPI003A8A22F6
MVGDSYSWLWNNPITREVSRCPKRVGDLIWADRYKGSSGQQVIEKVAQVVPGDMLNIPSYARWFVRIAGISGASAVALGAYGAHVFYRREYPEELKQVYETANRYHFLHTLALLGVPLCRRPKLAGSLIVIGTAIFCGTCYYYALSGSKNVRQYTPYGGMLLIVGWLAMAL